MNKKGTYLIDGGLSVDDRGCVRFVNDFSFSKVKRFYQVDNFSVNTIRAFHGHKKEAKYVYVSSGSALIIVAKLPGIKVKKLKDAYKKFILSSKKPQILHIPPKHINGFKALEKDTTLMFFSTTTLKESLSDDFRYPYDIFGRDIWKTQNR